MKHDNTKIDIELTKVDYAILDSYRDFCDGLSEYLGNGYEHRRGGDGSGRRDLLPF